MYRDHTIAVVIPAYNEEKLIGKTISKVPSFVDKIIVVDDASVDRTGGVAYSFKSKFGDKLVVVRHRRNQGVGGAIATGYKIALKENADICVIMAGDAQMDPSHMPLLLDPIVEDKADYAKGNRLFSKKIGRMPKARRRGNAILTLLTKIASGYWDVIDPQNGYTAASRKVLETIYLDKIHKRYGYCNDILVKLNIYNFRVLDVTMPPLYGKEKSGIKIRSYTFKMSWLLTKCFFYRIRKKYGGLKFHPLILFFLIGLVLFILGLIEGIVTLYYRFSGISVSDGTMIFTSLMLVTGLQFLLFGLLFDMLSTRYGTERKTGEMSKATKSFHPTIVGLFRRLRSKHWNSSFHPLALLYGAGIVLSLCGLISGIDVVYSRISLGYVSVGSMLLTLLLIVMGVQSIFFAMLFEMELSRR
ncbi:MAG: glycosyltransferase family 2 protein [Candidatus Heimdallarchaeota archaeon]|nr:MAG: glycosyltransferase family 2 protein [Candidatus Heimdallarchaeota archaeon]